LKPRMNRLKQILNEIVREYENIPEYRALALIGSYARGTAKEQSGIDLMGICFREPGIAERKKAAFALADPGTEIQYFDDPFMEDRFIRGGITISIWHVPQDMICDRVSSIEKRRRLESTVLIASLFESQILWDPRNQLLIWKKAINPIPDDYKKKIIPQIFAEVATVVSDLAELQEIQNTYFNQHEITIAIEGLFEILFLINGQYLNFSPRFETIVSGFALMPKWFLNRLKELLGTPMDGRGSRLRWRYLAELTKMTGDFLRKSGDYELLFGWEKLKRSAPFLFNL
jgi:hypothetical protein